LKEALKPYGETAKDALAYLDVKETSERFVNFSLCAPSRSSLLMARPATITASNPTSGPRAEAGQPLGAKKRTISRCGRLQNCAHRQLRKRLRQGQTSAAELAWGLKATGVGGWAWHRQSRSPRPDQARVSAGVAHRPVPQWARQDRRRGRQLQLATGRGPAACRSRSPPIRPRCIGVWPRHRFELCHGDDNFRGCEVQGKGCLGCLATGSRASDRSKLLRSREVWSAQRRPRRLWS
jgi:hypothetical protein